MSSEQVKISIITATFNSGRTLRDTLDSILRQSYQNYELIIKDGQSKDDTLTICREYEPRFEGRMRIISCPDEGMYDAMNQAVNLSCGEIVGILNSDDFYTDSDVLETIADAFQHEPDLDAVYADIHIVRQNDTSKTIRYYSGKRFRRNLMRLGYMPAHPSFYCKKSTYERFSLGADENGYLRFFDTSYKIAADFEILLRMIFVGLIQCRYIPKDFVTMRTGGASSSGIKSHLQINRDHMLAFRSNHVYSNIIFLSLRYVGRIRNIISAGFRRLNSFSSKVYAKD